MPATTRPARAIEDIEGLQEELGEKATTSTTDDHETRIQTLEAGSGSGGTSTAQAIILAEVFA